MFFAEQSEGRQPDPKLCAFGADSLGSRPDCSINKNVQTWTLSQPLSRGESRRLPTAIANRFGIQRELPQLSAKNEESEYLILKPGIKKGRSKERPVGILYTPHCLEVQLSSSCTKRLPQKSAMAKIFSSSYPNGSNPSWQTVNTISNSESGIISIVITVAWTNATSVVAVSNSVAVVVAIIVAIIVATVVIVVIVVASVGRAIVVISVIVAVAGSFLLRLSFLITLTFALLCYDVWRNQEYAQH